MATVWVENTPRKGLPDIRELYVVKGKQTHILSQALSNGVVTAACYETRDDEGGCYIGWKNLGTPEYDSVMKAYQESTGKSPDEWLALVASIKEGENK